MVYRSEYDIEISWLERVDKLFKQLRATKTIEEMTEQLSMLNVEYTQLQQRTDNIEHVNNVGGKFIHVAKVCGSLFYLTSK